MCVLNSPALLEVKNLSIAFGEGPQSVAVTDAVGFSVAPGEIYGLVGESGCGKTVTSLAILRLLPVPSGKIVSGSVLFKGRDLVSMNPPDLRKIRGGEISMIFQEPTASLNPLLTVEKQLMECFQYHPHHMKPGRRVREMLEQVGLSDYNRVLKAYPHELSGGMLQRVMIAMALLLKPQLIIADEPTTALDVTVQAQIMELLVGLRETYGTAILLITHNLNLIAQYADRLGVMYAGRMVEESTVDEFLEGPLHPYTQGLLAALPQLRDTRAIKPIPGQVPQPKDFKPGCRFADRCPERMEICAQKPAWTPKGNRRVACFLHEPSLDESTGKNHVTPG